MSSYQTIQVLLNSNIRDVKGQKVAQKCQTQLNIETGKVQSTKLYSVNYALSNDQVQAFGEHCIKDQVTDNILVNELYQPTDYACAIAIAKLPGVTDDEGTSAQMALADFLNIDIDVNTQHIFSQEIYFFQNELNAQQLQLIAKRILGNPLINHFTFATKEEGKISFAPYVPKVQMTVDDTTEYIDLELSDEELIHLSKTKVLALNLAEMKAVRDYYRNEDNLEQRSALGLSKQPTDCELEILAQTWSEHCKHKEFNAVINYENKETGETKKVNSLFKTT